jgi:hypothetical protein
MKPSIAFFFVALFAPCVAFSAPVLFTHSPLKGRQVISHVESQVMNLDVVISSDGAVIASMNVGRTVSETVVSALEVWTGKKKSATFTYGENLVVEVKTDPTGSATSKTDAAPVSGRAYRLSWTRKDDVVQVEGLQAGEVSEEERVIVLKDWAKVSATEPKDLAAVVAGQRLTMGEEVVSDPETMAKFLNLKGDQFSVQQAKVSFKESREENGVDLGVFAVELTLGTTNIDDFGGMDLSMSLTGEVVVTVDGLALRSSTLSGAITMAGEQDKGGKTMGIEGVGEMNFSTTRVVSR